MFLNPAANWRSRNQTYGPADCEHCGLNFRHEKWCVTCNAILQYADRVVTDPGKLTLPDRLILCAVGVAWGDQPYDETAKISQDRDLAPSSLRVQVRGH